MATELKAEPRVKRVAVTVTAMLVIGGLFTWWMVHRADQQTHLVAQTIDVEHVKALSGTVTDIAAKTVLPVGLMLALLILLASRLIATRPGPNELLKPIRRRLMVPLAIALMLLVGGFATVSTVMQKNNLDTSSRRALENASCELAESLDEHANALAALLQVFSHNADLRSALKNLDRESLLAEQTPVFKQLHEKRGITRFSFLGPNRVNLLRVHKPEKHGDLINRPNAREAERTGRTASGLELVAPGTLTLRVVEPVIDDGSLIGYLEMGKDIECILAGIHETNGVELAMTIHKGALDRTKWESGMAMLGREADWNRLAGDVLVYCSLPRLPSVCDRYIGAANQSNVDISAEVDFDGKPWRMLKSPVIDVSGAETGHLIVLRDVSAAKAKLGQHLTVMAGAALVLLALLFGFLHVILRQTDQGIRMQQSKLIKSEEQLRSIAENSTNLFYSHTVDHVLTYMSPQTRRFFDCSPEEAMQRWTDFATDNPVNKKGLATTQKAIDTGERQPPTELELVGKKSRKIWVRVNEAPVVHDGRTVAIVGALTDITEIKRAEEEQRAANEFQQQILDTAATAVFSVDSRRIITSVSREFCDMTGFSETEALGQHCDILGNEFCMAQCDLFGPERMKPVFRRQCSIRTKDGRRLTIVKNARVIRNEAGDITGGIETFIDVTELVEARDFAEKANVKLEQAVTLARNMAVEAEMATAAKNDFLANMNHEIRTPMNGIIGMTGLLLDTDLNPEQREFTDTVRCSSDTLLALINDILDFSTIEAGTPEMEMLDFDLHATLETFACSLAMRAHKKGLEFNCFIHPEVPSLVRGDPGRVRQVLTNLAGNAIKFTELGEIAVVAELGSEDKERVTVRFSIRDSGIGIPENMRKEVFNAFTQVDGSSTRQYGGTGLGLSISKQLVELMGGEIGVESTRGEGSTFWFTCSFEKQPGTRTVAEPTLDVIREFKDVRALVVDGNSTGQLVVGGLLERWGCRHDMVTDGQAALELLGAAATQKDPYHVAIVDMLLPEMDGAELARRIKADSDLEKTHLIMMSSLGKLDDLEQKEKIRFDDFLPKPVKQSALFACLTAILPRTQQKKVDETREKFTPDTPAESRGAETRILLVEDNITNQYVALAVLKKLGFRADPVANGKEALEALTLPYDLVLMDCQMPVMDGYEATRKIRQGADGVQNSEVPIIAMTANAMKGDREKCLEAGMSDYVAKPVKAAILREAIDRNLYPAEAETPPSMQTV